MSFHRAVVTASTVGFRHTFSARRPAAGVGASRLTGFETGRGPSRRGGRCNAVHGPYRSDGAMPPRAVPSHVTSEIRTASKCVKGLSSASPGLYPWTRGLAPGGPRRRWGQPYPRARWPLAGSERHRGGHECAVAGQTSPTSRRSNCSTASTTNGELAFARGARARCGPEGESWWRPDVPAVATTRAKRAL